MITSESKSGKPPGIAGLVLFQALLLAYPLLSFLWHRDYPLASGEALMLLALVVLAGTVLAAMLSRARHRVRNLFLAFQTTAVLILQFDLRLESLLIILALVLFVALKAGPRVHLHALPILALMVFGAYLDGRVDQGAIDPPTGAQALRQDLPPVVHILFDAFIGMEGMPHYPATRVVQADMLTLFESFGFTLYPRAYARHAATGDSMYTAMNFSARGDSDFLNEVAHRQAHAMKSNRYFDGLAALGYRLYIYQTGFLDFCATHPEATQSCWTYPQPNVRSILDVGGAGQRARMLARVLLSQSSLFRDLFRGRARLDELGIAVHDPRVFTRLRQDIASGANGRVFFAHLLLPHGPFAYQSDCSVDYSDPVWSRVSGIHNEGVLPDGDYEARYVAYYRQIQCALTELHTLLTEMQEAGTLEDSTVIIHGDHGSFIGRYPPDFKHADVLTVTELRTHFSTLFAVKSPGGSYFADGNVHSLDALLGHAARDIARAAQGLDATVMPAPGDELPFLYLSGAHPRYRWDIDIFRD